MLHRRPTSSVLDAGPSTPRGPAPLNGNVNKAYAPLRRQSSGLYATPQSGQRARYSLPSPSLTPNTHASGASFLHPSLGSNPNGAYDIGEEHFGLDVRTGVLAAVRVELDGFKQGFSDAIRLERSFSLVWRSVGIVRQSTKLIKSDPELRTLVMKSR